MRSVAVAVLLMFLSFSASASVDLEQTMKNMAFQYKAASKVQTSAELTPVLDELIRLTQQSLTASYPADKEAQFKQGLNKVLAELNAAKKAAAAEDVALAKQHLQKVDALRKEYHKLRKVSFWDLLCG